MAESLGQFAIVAMQPITGVVGDREFAAGVVRQTMVAGLIVSASAFDRGIVLGDMEIDRPWPKSTRKCLHRLVEPIGIRPIPFRREDCVLGRVVAKDV